MPVEHACIGADDPDPRGIWRKRLAQVQRKIRGVENAVEDVAHLVWGLVDQIGTGDPIPPLVPRPRKTRSHSKPIATECDLTAGGSVTFVVCDVAYRVELSAFRVALIGLLAAATRESPDALVGFKTTASLVHLLRRGPWQPTAHSVTVEIGRLRKALGPLNRDLLETRRGAGYRIRLPQSAAASARPDPMRHPARPVGLHGVPHPRRSGASGTAKPRAGSASSREGVVPAGVSVARSTPSRSPVRLASD